MAKAAVFHKDIGIGAVVGVFVCPGAFSAFYGNVVVPGCYCAGYNVDVTAGVKVYAVGARGLERLYWSMDVDSADKNPSAFIKVDVPECRVP